MSSLSSHVLDTTSGKPVANLSLTLTTANGEKIKATTDDDGRCKNWGNVEFVAGTYCLRFHCEEYLLTTHGESFFPFADIHFHIAENGGHYHVPLLLSPYSFSTYRGS